MNQADLGAPKNATQMNVLTVMRPLQHTPPGTLTWRQKTGATTPAFNCFLVIELA